MDPRRLQQLHSIFFLALVFVAGTTAVGCGRPGPQSPDRSGPSVGGPALAQYVQARGLYGEERLEEALLLLEELRHSDPGFSASSYLLGKIHFFRAEYPAAREAWESTLAYNPHHLDTRKWLARLDLQEARAGEAEELMLTALSDSSEDPELLVLLGKARRARGDLAGAIECYRKAQVLSERLAEASLELAELYGQFGLPEQAAEELRRAQDLLPADAALSQAVQAAARHMEPEGRAEAP